MKPVFLRITAAILMAGALTGCGANSSSQQAQGEVEVLAPKMKSTGSYSLDVLTLIGIEDLETMKGKFAQFFMSPRILGNRLHGRPPVGRFIKNSEGQFVPGNDLSQQLTSIYFHLQNFAALDEELGAKGVNSWPRSVGVGIRIKGGNSFNNAFYDGTTDSMLFVPYTRQNMAIAINGGILAHEHFHSLFYKLTLQGTSLVKLSLHNRGTSVVESFGEEFSGSSDEDSDVSSDEELSEKQLKSLYEATLMRGINEGLADFWGWMYSGDPDFIAQSLPSARHYRSLNSSHQRSASALPQSRMLKNYILELHRETKSDFQEFLMSHSYTMGTQFSRFMKRYSDIRATARGVDSLQGRKETAKLVIKMLPLLKSALSKGKDDVITSVDFVNALITVNDDLKKTECDFLAMTLTNSDDDATTVFECVNNKDQWLPVSKPIPAEDHFLVENPNR